VLSFTGDTVSIINQSASDTKFDLVKAASDTTNVQCSNSKCLLRGYKDASFQKITCTIDDKAPGQQWVTEVIPLVESNVDWITKNCATLSSTIYSSKSYLRSGAAVLSSLASTAYSTYSDSSAGYSISNYLKSMYLSIDGGKTRIPFYVITKAGTTTATSQIPVALVAQFKPEINTELQPVQMATEVFLDQDFASTYDYIKQTNKAELLLSLTCKGYQVPQFYEVKNAVMAYPGVATIDYSSQNPFQSNWSKLCDDMKQLTTYHLEFSGDMKTALTDGKKNPTYLDNNNVKYTSKNKTGQMDTSITSSQYEMDNPYITKPFRTGTDTLQLTAKLKEAITFYGTQNLIWKSSDTSIATIQYPSGVDSKNYGSNGLAAAEIVPTGKAGKVYFTVYALNGKVKGLTPVEVCRSVTLFCDAGKDPYLGIPSSNGETPHLSCNVKSSLDVCFTSNLTAKNADEAKFLSTLGSYALSTYPTEFRLEVYEADYKGQPTGSAVYSTKVLSTNNNTIGKMTIPKGTLTKVSTSTETVYVAKISADSIEAVNTSGQFTKNTKTMTATVGITVYPNPPTLTLSQLSKYSILDTAKLSITYNLVTNGSTIASNSLTIIDSSGNTVLTKALTSGKHTVSWTPNKVTGKLKETYVVKVSLQVKQGDTPTMDSYVVNVYNSKALDILVDSVDGKTSAGVNNKDAYTLDNHSKIQGLIKKGEKTITLGTSKISLNELSNDINLASMISINYGDYVWAQIDDQISWSTENVTSDNQTNNEVATTLNYQQDGAYSEISNYNYTSYSPSDNFMAVGVADGKTKITATHAQTGMKSSIEVTTKTLKNQLYLFKFMPTVKTRLEYTNGDKKACTVYSDSKGELALYEEHGICSDVHLYAEAGEDTYVGTITRQSLLSGEQDISKLQYYPVNNYKLSCISKVELYFQDENGKPYANKNVWLRSGIYKNMEYCYLAKIGLKKSALEDGKIERAYKTNENGAIIFYADSSQFFTEKEETDLDRALTTSDIITYAFEVKYQTQDQISTSQKVYEPQFIHVASMLNPLSSVDDCEATVTARVANTGINTPIINTQYYCQLDTDGNIGEISDIYSYKGAIGLSATYPTALVKTETIMWGDSVEYETYTHKDKDGVVNTYGKVAKKIDESKYSLSYADSYGMIFVNQKSKAYTYEFADMPVIESTWEIKKDELTNVVENGKVVSLQSQVSKDGKISKVMVCDFRCSNNSEEDAINENSKDDLQNILDNICDYLDLKGALAEQISKDKLFKYAGDGLNALLSKGGIPLTMELTPTKDPRCFHLTVTLEDKEKKSSEDQRYYDENGNLVNEYHDYRNDFDEDTEEDKGHSNTEYADAHGLSNGDGRWTATHRKNSGVKNIFKKGINSCYNVYNDYKMKTKREYEQAQAQRMWSKKMGKATLSLGGVMYYEIRYGGNKKWEVISYGGGIKGGFGVNFEKSYNFMIGPIPGTATLSLGAEAKLGYTCLSTGDFEGIENKNNYLVQADLTMMCDLFCGVGWDWGIAAVKFGTFGTLKGENHLKKLNGWEVNYKEKLVDKEVNMTGLETKLSGEVGLRFTVKLLFFHETYVLCSYYHDFWNHENDDYEKIGDWWKKASQGVHSESLDSSAKLMAVQSFEAEGREYLAAAERKWVGGSNKALTKDGTNNMQVVQSNAYTYAEPVYNDDGSIIAYLSDSNSEDLEGTLASYAVNSNGKYVDKRGIYPVTYTTDELNNTTGAKGKDGALDPIYDSKGNIINKHRTTPRTGYGDSTLRIAGTKSFSAAAWVRQKSSIPLEKNGQASYNNLKVALNQAEICASIWNGQKWTSFTLTQDYDADISPVVAVNDKKAIVAWRSCVGSSSTNPTQFDVQDSINARIYDKATGKWGDVITLYNGRTGSVHALEVSIMSDGTAIAAYIIKTGKQAQVMTDAEIMYTIVDSKGKAGESIRVTNDKDIDQNIQVTKVKWNGAEHFILGWLNERASSELDNEGKAMTVRDVRLLAINAKGLPSSDFIESIHSAGAEIKSAIFKFSQPAKDATLDDLSIVWLNMEKDEEGLNEGQDQLVPQYTYSLEALHFLQNNGKVMLSAPVEVVRLDEGDTIDGFSCYGNHESIQAVLQSTTYYSDTKNSNTYQAIKVAAGTVDSTCKEEKKFVSAIGITNLYTVTSKYKVCAVETEEPVVDREQVIPGFSVPIGFTVTNTGTSKIDKLVLTLNAKNTTFDSNILPGEKQSVIVYYDIPLDQIYDVTYTITAKGEQGTSTPADCTGVIKLNVPDVMISDAQIVKEENNDRTIQVALDNRGHIPFKKSGKQIVVGIFDENPEENEEVQPFDTITISNDSDLDLVDSHAYNCQFTIPGQQMDELLRAHFSGDDLRASKNEIPSEGLMIYTKAWIVNKDGTVLEEDCPGDNFDTVRIESLIEKYQSKCSISSYIEKTSSGVNAIITLKNNSYATRVNHNVSAALCDKDGKVISKLKKTYDTTKTNNGLVSLGTEESKVVNLAFAQADMLTGHKISEAVSVQVNYGPVNVSDENAKLDSLQIVGQNISVDQFKTVKKDSNQEPEHVMKEFTENGKKVKKEVELDSTTLQTTQSLNYRQLQTVISAVPTNVNDAVTVEVNGVKVGNCTGTVMKDISLKYGTNEIKVTVQSSKVKLRKTWTKIVDVDQNGSQNTGSTTNDETVCVETYVAKQCVYKILLNFDRALLTYDENYDTVDTDKVLANEGVLNPRLLTKVVIDKDGNTTSTTKYITWNKVPEADGYLIYKRVRDTVRLEWIMSKVKRLTSTSNTYQITDAEVNSYFTVKAFKVVDGKDIVIAKQEYVPK